MSEVVALFDAATTGFLESFSSSIEQVFSSFELKVHSGEVQNQELDNILQSLLLSFPGSNREYKGIISALTELATSSPAPILLHLGGKFKRELSRTMPDMSDATIQISSLTFKATNPHHFQFSRYLGLIFLSDLAYSIFSECPIQQSHANLVASGYTLCNSIIKLPQLQHLLIEKWSYIFAAVSQFEMTEITLAFDQFSDDSNMELVFWLVCRVKATQKFAEMLLNAVQAAKKKKLITSSMLSALSVFLSVVRCSDDLLNEFYSFAWGLKSNGSLKEGAFEMIATVSARLPQQKKIKDFFAARVYKRVGDDEKVERSAKAFLRLIQGDISKVELQKQWTNLNYVGCSGTQANTQDANDSYSRVFMKVFFAKANFGVCIELFGDIIIHLAALDIKFFDTNMVPQFLKLKPNDPRFVAFLKAVVGINDPLFSTNALCKPTEEQIKSINATVRSVLLSLIPKLEEFALEHKMVLLAETTHLISKINQGDQKILKFMKTNKYTSFEPCCESSVDIGQVSCSGISLMWCAIHCLTHSATIEDLSDGTLAQLLIKLAIVKELEISEAAIDAYHFLADHNAEIRLIFIRQALNMIKENQSNELTAHAISLLYVCIQGNHLTKMPKETKEEIELIAFMLLLNDFIYIRTKAFQCLKHLAAAGAAENFNILLLASEQLSEAFNRSILVLNVPDKPSMITPPLGTLTFETVCCSRYLDLWIIFISEMLNILIANKKKEFLISLREILHGSLTHIESLVSEEMISQREAIIQMVVYIDTFAIDVPEVENEEGECVIPDIDLGVMPLISELTMSKSPDVKRILVQALRYVNWRVIPSIMQTIMSIDQELYPEAAASLSFIIQNPENFHHIIASVFRKFIEFLAMFQSYFIRLEINSPRELQLDDHHMKLLKKYESLCVDYCIIVSAAFNNILDQIPETEWPLSYRQVLVQFLIHWAQLPQELSKIQAYAINALIPIIHAGPVFAEGFVFDMKMLEMMVGCQLAGYPVLDSLLLYHADILLDEYVKNAFLRPRQQAQLFHDAILSVLSQTEDSFMLQAHVGSLILLALHSAQECLDEAKMILRKIAALFLDVEDSFAKVMEESTDLKYVPNMFQFATEQLIWMAFDIIKSGRSVIVTKLLVTLLLPWFDKIRLLPTHRVIIQGVPSKFRKYTVMSFLYAMIDVSNVLGDERHDLFCGLWYELLRSSDNSVVVLLCLFESEQDDNKEKIFKQLLHGEPVIISRYLTKRLSFAYWYFIRTERQLNVSSIKWAINVVTQAFIEYVNASAPRFTLALHFSLLFIEDSKQLYEALISVFALEVIEACFVWTIEGSTGMVRAARIVSEISAMLKEERPEAIEKWSNEAFRWAVGCCDIQIAYRSIVILNALDCSLPAAYTPLLCDAVYYHLGRASEDHCDEIVGFVSECFDLLYKPIHVGDIALFAYQFANQFLNCPIFYSALRKAMPIFIYCFENPVLDTSTNDILVDAFIPFLSRLESDFEVQKLLKHVIEITAAPCLYLVAAAFLGKSLPFVDVGKTYREIMAINIRVRDAEITMRLFGVMLKNASRQLMDSIISISGKMLLRFEKYLDKNAIYPIYETSLHRIAVLKSAADFITVLMRVNPGLAQHTYNPNQGKKDMAAVRRDLSTLLDKNVEIAPMTNFEQLAQLKGIIDQKNPPKVYPFTSQYEMYQKLKEDEHTQGTGRPTQKKWSSTVSMASGLISHRSMLLPTTQFGIDFAALQMDPIPHNPITVERLQWTTSQTLNRNLIISPTEFLHLKL